MNHPPINMATPGNEQDGAIHRSLFLRRLIRGIAIKLAIKVTLICFRVRDQLNDRIARTIIVKVIVAVVCVAIWHLLNLNFLFRMLSSPHTFPGVRP